jgi:hypothetical protein
MMLSLLILQSLATRRKSRKVLTLQREALCGFLRIDREGIGIVNRYDRVEDCKFQLLQVGLSSTVLH